MSSRAVTGVANPSRWDWPLLFAPEMLGAVQAAAPETVVAWDGTKTYADAAGFTRQERGQVVEGNVRRVYPPLDTQLVRAGR